MTVSGRLSWSRSSVRRKARALVHRISIARLAVATTVILACASEEMTDGDESGASAESGAAAGYCSPACMDPADCCVAAGPLQAECEQNIGTFPWGFLCEQGVCTIYTCEDDPACEQYNPGTRCVAVSDNGRRGCGFVCSTDAECVAEFGDGFTCNGAWTSGEARCIECLIDEDCGMSDLYCETNGQCYYRCAVAGCPGGSTCDPQENACYCTDEQPCDADNVCVYQ